MKLLNTLALHSAHFWYLQPQAVGDAFHFNSAEKQSTEEVAWVSNITNRVPSPVSRSARHGRNNLDPIHNKSAPHTQYNTPDHISPSSVVPNPLDQFHAWFDDAVARGVHEPEAMSLSTCTPSGLPSARIVLFKALDPRGFLFYTNYTSRKSNELTANPHCALVFYWREVHRSVRVVGKAEKVGREESEAYFKSRPVGSRLGAWASRQSTVVGEDKVHERLERIKERFSWRRYPPA
ncbi:Pyridoxamine 5-phosphate oxidase [Mycena sanguinolenta]|uniref:pyridoxal 5'-phosphate synthase n=1 Tax=Mycena sanguinolenta TaxID=230812 RepID=A0A8H6XR79_9AGAR|nr:Pyridoxamine 5-phosphate oxidase [Mycena sanguinolenta]